MNQELQKNGHCLCGKVQITISPPRPIFDACHCGMCRRWGGGPILTIEGGDNFKIQGEESVAVFESSPWAERAFCKHCGTHIYYHLKNAKHFFPLGLFENVEDFKFQVQIFTDSKPKHYDFANQTEMMTEAEVMAKFGAST